MNQNTRNIGSSALLAATIFVLCAVALLVPDVAVPQPASSAPTTRPTTCAYGDEVIISSGACRHVDAVVAVPVRGGGWQLWTYRDAPVTLKARVLKYLALADR